MRSRGATTVFEKPPAAPPAMSSLAYVGMRSVMLTKERLRLSSMEGDREGELNSGEVRADPQMLI